MTDKLADIRAELARQDEALAHFTRTVEALGDVALRVPHAFLEALDERTAPTVPAGLPTLHGLRA